jgi:hypothetical protein
MNKKIAAVLIFIAISLIVVRLALLGSTELSDDQSWLLSINVQFRTDAPDTALVSLQQPFESANVRLNRRTLHHTGMQLVHRKHKEQTIRTVTFKPREAGEHYLAAEFLLQSSKSARFFTFKPSHLTEAEREMYLQIDEILVLTDEAYQYIADATTLDLAEKDDIPQILVDYLFNLPTNAKSSVGNLSDAVVLGSLTEAQKAIVMVSVCRRLNIPSRVVAGVALSDDPDARIMTWVEVHENNSWVPYYPEKGFAKELPAQYVTIDKKGQGILTYQDIDVMNWGIEIEELPQSPPVQDISQRHWHDIFNLNRLPADVREQLVLLALLPLGALITAIVRQVVGVHSYGVFTPTMLALAMVYTSAVTTMTILLVIAAAIYLGKPAMHSAISRTPRLSIIFVFVALGMLIGVSILEFMNLNTEGHLILLPIVILTSLVDRFLLTLEKDGRFIAMYRLFWTSLIALGIIPVLGLEWLGIQLLGYPELHLVTVALLLFMADYQGKKIIQNQYLEHLSEDKLKNHFRL